MFNIANAIALIISMMIFNNQDHTSRFNSVQPAPVLEIDSLALVALYYETDGENWVISWDLQTPVSTWHGIGLGIDTNGIRVNQINLENNNLLGKIPPNIGNLSALRILRLQRNNLIGNIPTEIIQLSNLTEIFLYDNSITGTLPDSIGKLSKLRMLSLASNQIKGVIPSSIGLMIKLRQLVLNQNKFNGSLPEEITNLKSLTLLDLHNNSLEGSLPDSLHHLESIEELLIYDNHFNGNIPSSISQCDHLTHFWANNNSLSGRLPDLSQVPIVSLRIADNNLSDLGDLYTIKTLGKNNPNGVAAEQNELSFDDIIYHLQLIDSINFTYNPQKEIQLEDTILVRSGDPWIYQLPFDDTITSSSYKWLKNDQIVELTNDNRFIIPAVSKLNEGLYSCRVTNRVIKNMSLTTSQVRLVVKEASDCGNPPPADECFLAETLCSLGELDDYCADMDSLSNQEILTFCNQNFTLFDRDWFSFIAGETDIRIRLTPYNCSSNSNSGMVAWVFENCNLGTPLNCDTICQKSTFEIAVGNLNIGQIYYIMIGGCNGICSYEMDIRRGGSSLDLDDPNQIIGEKNICDMSLEYTYSLDKYINSSISYEWKITHPDTSFIILDSAFSTKWKYVGQYEICVRAMNECDTSNYKCKQIIVFPTLEIVDHDTQIYADDDVYSVTFKIKGGQSPFRIDGATGTFNSLNRVFTSDIIGCKKSYFITVTDVNGCRVIIEGSEHCNCLSFAGNMSNDMIQSCEFSPFKAEHLGSEILDTNDVAFFVFHEASANNQLGNIIDINTTGIFRYNQQLMFLDTIYHVTYVVGNKLRSGGLQFNDPCLSLSNHQLVVFHKEPAANAGRDQMVCYGSFTLQSILSDPRSTGNWQYLNGPKRPTIDRPNKATTEVIIDTSGTYVFRWLEVNNGCIGSDSVTVEVRPQIKLQINGVEALCDGLKTQLSVLGKFKTYMWSNGDSTAIVTIEEPGIYSLTVTDDLGCTAFASKEIKEEDSPLVIIEGDNKACTGEVFELSSHEKFAKYEWSTGDTTRTIMTDFEGIVCVTITNSNGCRGDDCIKTGFKEASQKFINSTICYGDSLIVGQEVLDTSGHYEIVLKAANIQGCDSTIIVNLFVHPEIFIADSLVANDDGSGNGAISVSIDGGKRPFNYSWDHGATSPFLSRLEAGVYILTVTDDNECKQEFVFNIKSTVPTNSINNNGLKLGIFPNISIKGQPIRIIGSSDIPVAINLDILTTGNQIITSKQIHLTQNEQAFTIRKNLNPGLYFVVVKKGNKTIKVLKIVVE